MEERIDPLDTLQQVLRDALKKPGFADERMQALFVKVVEAAMQLAERSPPPPGPPPKGSLACNFCMKGRREVRKLIAGPGVYICDECIRLCNDIVAEEIDAESRRAAEATELAASRRVGVLLMVVERYRAGNPDAVGARFREKGRMLPPGVEYVASWLTPAGDVCWQLMKAPDRAALDPWLRAWEDLVEFEVTPVLPSVEFWAKRGA